MLSYFVCYKPSAIKLVYVLCNLTFAHGYFSPAINFINKHAHAMKVVFCSWVHSD